jgi:hypothetical protein
MAYVNESVNGIAFCCREAIEDPQNPLRGATFVSENFGLVFFLDFTKRKIRTINAAKVGKIGFYILKNLSRTNIE